MFLGPINLKPEARARIRAVVDEKSETEVRDLLEDCIASVAKLHIVGDIFDAYHQADNAALVRNASKAVTDEANRLFAERTAWKTIKRIEDVQA